MKVRILLLLAAAIWQIGCTSMMLGGAGSGGYQPPQDECADGEDNEACKE